ncbi:MAG TPA: heterodisulfide reductase [Thermoplasmatales archaeon]|nr:heterodisulfide reductase [Thermoplasmatales archaeon]
MDTILSKVEELSGENLYACYQCGKCSAGCPMVEQMDFLPNQIILLIIRGDESVIESKTPWVCAQCYQCGVRCPKNVDITKIMEALRLLKLRKNVDYMKIGGMKKNLPQIAVVSASRKYTG